MNRVPTAPAAKGGSHDTNPACHEIQIKRVYDSPPPRDGKRILVERGAYFRSESPMMRNLEAQASQVAERLQKRFRPNSVFVLMHV
jgi:hypothetical protein